MVFPKRSCWNMIFLVLSGKMVFFFSKTCYFFLGRKVTVDPFEEVHGNMKFSVYTYGCCKRGSVPLCQKNQRLSYAAKIHQKVIDVLDWHSRKSSSSFLSFHGDFYRRFHILLPSEKKTKILIYRTDVWLLLQFVWFGIFCNE